MLNAFFTDIVRVAMQNHEQTNGAQARNELKITNDDLPLYQFFHISIASAQKAK